MTTKYYIRGLTCPAACEHCSLPSEVEIAYSAGAGHGDITFILNRYEPHAIPFGAIDSWREWKTVLRNMNSSYPEAVIGAQYSGEAVPVEQFIQMVERSPKATYPQVSEAHISRDSEGYALTSAES